MDEKRCCKCKENKEVSLFSKCKREKSGLQVWCKACMKSWKPEVKRAYDRKKYYEHNDEWRNQNYIRRYGISLQEYNAKLEEQNNVCKLCLSSCTTGRRLAVDHCHTTGKVRGLLCKNCNQALGLFKESADLIEKAADYIKENSNVV
jgi:Recombination endonuclease VII